MNDFYSRSTAPALKEITLSESLRNLSVSRRSPRESHSITSQPSEREIGFSFKESLSNSSFSEQLSSPSTRSFSSSCLPTQRHEVEHVPVEAHTSDTLLWIGSIEYYKAQRQAGF
eukprot:763940-Hanusia_phi.AAC.3